MKSWRDKFRVERNLQVDETELGLVLDGEALSLNNKLTDFGLMYFTNELKMTDDALREVADEIVTLQSCLAPEDNRSAEDIELLGRIIEHTKAEQEALLDYRQYLEVYLTKKDRHGGAAFKG